jgi:hypothetical protein
MAITSAGEGEDQVVAAHDDLVEQAPPVGGGGKAQRHAEADADPHRDIATAMEVCAPIISIDSMSRPNDRCRAHRSRWGRLQPVGDGDAGDGVGRPDEAEERHGEEDRRDRGADQEGFGKRLIGGGASGRRAA